MDEYYIFVNGQAYSGESDDVYVSDYGGNGWHINNHKEATVLLFGGEPHKIEGNINLKSHLNKILKRSRDGQLSINKIEINVVGESEAKICENFKVDL